MDEQTTYTAAGNPLCSACHSVIVAEAGDTCAAIPTWQRGAFEYCAPADPYRGLDFPEFELAPSWVAPCR